MSSAKSVIKSKSTSGAAKFCSVVTALFTLMSLNAQQVQLMRSPMVVGIVVEGLSEDYLTLLRDCMPDGGFKRLMRDGLTISDIRYGTRLDPQAAAAVLLTGAAPSVNGVAARTYFNPETGVSAAALLDSRMPGNFSDETLSPKGLKVSTLSDEVRIDTDGAGYVYSLAADPQTAIIGAGHAGNGAFWINEHTGHWASSAYYRDMPSAVSNRNYSNPLHARLDTIRWVPSMAMESYPLLSKAERAERFSYTYPQRDFDRFRRLRSTPPGNTEVTDLALELIASAGLGKDTDMDMLQLSYTLTPEGASRAEIMDAYLRLDRDLARLFAAIDRQAGFGRSAIFLAGVPSAAGATADDPRWKTPAGEFSVPKAKSLLGMHLMTLHGNGEWLQAYNNRQFWLNRKLITDRGLDLATFRAECADFLARMAGIVNVYTIDDIIAARAGEDPAALKRNTPVEHCGDIFIEVNPGWSITEETHSKQSKQRRTVERADASRFPAFILAPGFQGRRIDYPVDARSIAPAVARVIRIRAPSAASTPAFPVE